MYAVVFSKHAQKDKALLKAAGLEGTARAFLNLLMEDPYRTPPRDEKLSGDLSGFYSRRLNRQHRIVYSVDRQARIVHILRMWTHYA